MLASWVCSFISLISLNFAVLFRLPALVCLTHDDRDPGGVESEDAPIGISAPFASIEALPEVAGAAMERETTTEQD